MPYLIRDREYLREGSMTEESGLLLATPLQYFSAPDDGLYVDGPAHPRVAVVDFSRGDLKLRGQTRFRPKGVGRTVSCYDLGKQELDADSPIEAFESDTFLRVNPFATVLKTLAFFEGPEVLGRTLDWAFPGSQLLIVPRAGEWQNAFYDRSTGSLQFYYHRASAGHTVYTALSHDIVVHETTHAILDAIAPDLYHASSPQALAIHEAIADVSAITQTLMNEMVVWSVDNISSSGVDAYDALSRIAEEFGTDTRLADGAGFLRRLKNSRHLNPEDGTQDEFGRPNRPDVTDLHALSQVLSGAIYCVFEQRMRATHRRGDSGFGATLDEIVCPAARRVARIVFRALDYMPPGEAGFRDYGRAFVAAAAATYERPQLEQKWLLEEFKRRHIIQEDAELLVAPPALSLEGVDMEALVKDDDVARRLVEANRAALGIARGTAFEVLPRLVASRSLGSKLAKNRKEEVILKVKWLEGETHDLGLGRPSTWQVVHGTTLVVDRETRRVRSCLTTESSAQETSDRRALLTRWMAEGRIRDVAPAPDGLAAPGVGLASTQHGGARLHDSASVLHLSEAPV